MTSDPQERRLHPAATAIDAIRHARAAAAGALVVIVSQGLVRGGLLVLGLLAIAVIAAFVQWRTTRYTVVDRTLRMRTGVFSRNERNIPASRISALDTSRGVLQRIFGVVAVQVQTAGGGKAAEISLRAVSFAEAERLRHELGHRAAGDAPTHAPALTEPTGAPSGGALRFTTPGATAFDAPPTAAHERTVYSLTPGELVLAALTSPSIAVVGAAGAAALSLGSDALPERAQRQLATSVDELTLTAAAFLVFAGLIGAAVISVMGTVLMYGGFRVTRDERRLRVRRGVLTERASTIPLGRIHGVRIIESPLRQLLGLAAIEVEVAGYAGQDEVTRTLVPLIRHDEIPELLRKVVPDIVWPDRPLEAIPARARRRYLTVPLLLSAPFSIALLVAPIGWWAALAVVPPMAAALFGRLEARDAGWLLSHATLTIRWRRVARITVLAESPRLQRAEGSVSPLQRRANLSTFEVRLSNARTATVRHLDGTTVQALLARTGRP